MSRIFRNFTEAFSEIKRDLAEMGIDVHTKTMQNKNIENDDNYSTKELQFYSYTVLEPFKDLKNLVDRLPNGNWACSEWEERLAGIQGHPVNPGEAYKLRDAVWNEFINEEGKFDYSYSERFAMNDQVNKVIEALKRDNLSRQAYITIWKPEDSSFLGTAISRVPCSLSYLFQYRQGQLNMEYSMRSCDFNTHFPNDVFEALMLHAYVANQTGLTPGNFIHHIASLHVYKKDIANVF